MTGQLDQLPRLIFYKHSESSPREIRLSVFFTFLGILTSFLVLALGAVVARSLGITLGWGIHFQQPVFITFLAMIMLLFTLNLWGLYEIEMPAWLLSAIPRLGTQGKHDYVSDFFSGVIVTLMTTPCSAPFLGTAASFALSQPPLLIVLVFLSIGTGLGTPYLVILLRPSWIRWFPKPGRWMVLVKTFMGLLLFVTLLWLLLVLTAQVSETGLYVLLGLHGAMAFFVILSATLPKPAIQIVSWALVVALFPLGLWLAGSYSASYTKQTGSKSLQGGLIPWQRFDRNELRRLIEANHVVFVDVTADWCITCKANEKLVLETNGFKHLIGVHQAIPLKADWTNPDPEIESYLAEYDQRAIPFYAVYGPAQKTGTPLATLLTLDIVKQALEAASGVPH